MMKRNLWRRLMIAVHFSVSLDQSQLSGWELMGEVLSARFTNCCRPYAGVHSLTLPGLTGASPHVVHHPMAGHLPAPACQLQHFAFHGQQLFWTDNFCYVTFHSFSSCGVVFRASSLPTDWAGITNIGLRHAQCALTPRRWWWWWWWDGQRWDYLLFVLYTVWTLPVTTRHCPDVSIRTRHTVYFPHNVCWHWFY